MYRLIHSIILTIENLQDNRKYIMEVVLYAPSHVIVSEEIFHYHTPNLTSYYQLSKFYNLTKKFPRFRKCLLQSNQ